MNHDVHALLDPTEHLPLTAAERSRVYTHVRRGMAAESAARRRRERRREVLAPVLVGSCAAAVLLGVLFMTIHPTPSAAPVAAPRPVVAEAQAVATLDRAAGHVGQRATPAPAPDQLVYTRSIVVSNDGVLGGPVSLGARHVREIWLSQRSSAIRSTGLIREFGQDWPIEGGSATSSSLRRPTYAYLASLPTDPDRLLDALEQQIPPWDDARSENQVLFDELVNLVREQLAPPRTTAAIYRALTRIPGVQVDPDAHDLLGRPGVGITRTEGVFLTREALIVDPATGEVRGSRSYMQDADGTDVLFNADAVVDQAVVDREGEEPVRRGTAS